MICSKTSFSAIRYPVKYKKTLGRMGRGVMDTGIGLCERGGHDGLPFQMHMGAVIWVRVFAIWPIREGRSSI